MPQITFNHGNMRVRFPRAPERVVRPSRPSESHNAYTSGVVYANDRARRALSDEESLAPLPVGSVVVREKYVGADDAAPPELVAAMVKRARGFNPKGGDWEFLVLDPSLTKVLERQKTGSCLECHDAQRRRDFLFPLTRK